MGDCLSIHLREKEGGGGEGESENEEVEEICFQPLSSSQSARSHTNLFISPLDRLKGDRQRDRQRK